MADYTWPSAWKPARFEMRVVPNSRVFVGPYTPTTQVLDLLGERWQISFDLPTGVDRTTGAAMEAFFDRLKGPANRMLIWNLRFPYPLGTLRQSDVQTVSVVNGSLAAVTVQNGASATVTVQSGVPQLAAGISQGANTAPITGIPGRTIVAGTMLGLSTTQTVRTMADVTLDANGQGTIEFQPRARQAYAMGTLLLTDKPTIPFILKAEGVPIVWRFGVFDGPAIEAIEAP